LCQTNIGFLSYSASLLDFNLHLHSLRAFPDTWYSRHFGKDALGIQSQIPY